MGASDVVDVFSEVARQTTRCLAMLYQFDFSQNGLDLVEGIGNSIGRVRIQTILKFLLGTNAEKTRIVMQTSVLEF